MWAIVTASGELVTERDGLWPALDPEIQIAELRYRDRSGAVGTLSGYDAYGFQRYSLSVPGAPGIEHAGTQLIAVHGDEVTVIDINEVTGVRDQKRIPRSELTYAPALLRAGMKN